MMRDDVYIIIIKAKGLHEHLAKKLDDNVSRQLSFFHTRFLLKPEIHTNDTKVAVQNGKHVKIFSQSLSF
jgi:hypothetical protein